VPGNNPGQIGRSPAQIGTSVGGLGNNPAQLARLSAYGSGIPGLPRRPFIYQETIAAPFNIRAIAAPNVGTINVGPITMAPNLSISWKGTPTQVLQLQQDSLSLLQNSLMQSKLDMTPDQKAYLPGLAAWSNEQTGNLYALEATNPAGFGQAYRNYQADFQNRFNGLLTPQQWSKWSDMTQPPAR
jgi:hypothetical protein